MAQMKKREDMLRQINPQAYSQFVSSISKSPDFSDAAEKAAQTGNPEPFAGTPGSLADWAMTGKYQTELPRDGPGSRSA